MNQKIKGKTNQKQAFIPKIKSEPGDSFLKGYLPLLWIAILGLGIYLQSLKFDYTYLDDQELVLQHMEKLKDFSQLGKIFNEDAFHSYQKGFYYRPLLTLSFMFDAVTGHGKFSFFHFSNILFHIFSAYFLFLLFLGLGYRRRLSFVIAMIFAAHPALVQAVAWVPGRNDSLLALFALPSLLFFIKYLKDESVKFQAFHFIFYILALLTKESAIAIPVVAFAYMLAVKKINWKVFLINSFSWIGITFIWLVIRYKALQGSSGFSLEDSLTAIWQNLPAILPYLGKVFIPVKLSVLPAFKDLTFHLYAGIAAVGFLIYIFTTIDKKRYFFFLLGLVWFLVFLIPCLIRELHSVPDFTEHRLYLPIAGVFMMIAEFPAINKIKKNWIPGLLLLLLAVLSFLHTDNFKSRVSFWKNAVETSPSFAFSQNNLGAMYYMSGNNDQAEKYFRRAIELNPDEPMANGNLGLVLMNTNQPKEAEKFMLNEIRINPLYDNGYFNLGLLYFKASMGAYSVPYFEKTIEVNPYYTDAYKYLVYYYLNKKDTVSASAWVEKAGKYNIRIFEK